MIKILKWWPSTLTLLAVLWITLVPEPVPENDIPMFEGADKLIHAIMMGGLAGAYMFDYKRTKTLHGEKIPGTVILFICLLVCLFSVVDEIAQGLMNIGRSFDLFDIIADFIGVAIAAVLAPTILRPFGLKD